MMGPLFANLVFTNPLIGLGVLGLGVPVFIHLLTRRTPRRIVFPMVKFLRRSQASQSRLFRLRHWLMLLVRTALILLVLLAFLKPVLYSAAPLGPPGGRIQRTALILLDVSASMDRSTAGITPLTRGKLAAEEILNQLGGGDQVNLIQMGYTPQVSQDKPGTNLFHLRIDLKKARGTEEYPDVDAAIAEAVQQLNEVSSPKKIIYFISDFQRSNWAAVDFGKIPRGIQPVFIPVGDAEAVNRAITEVKVAPATPAVSEPVQIILKVANYGPRSSEIPVAVKIGEEQALTRTVTAAAQTTESVSFRIRARQSGQYECLASLPDDALAADNRRYFALRITDQINILVVSDRPREERGGGARFLMRAVNPFVDPKQGTVKARLVRSGELDGTAVAGAQVIFLTGIHELTRLTAKHLMQYLQDGGHLVYFLVEGSAAYNLKLLAEVSEGEFTSPFKLMGQVAHPPQETFATLAEANFDHPLLRKFKERQELGDLQFYRYFSTERVKQKGRVLLRYDDRNIAMAQKTVGTGSMLLCNFSPALAASDVIKHTLFVPLIHEMIRHLRPGLGAGGAYEVGAACSTTIGSVSRKDAIECRDPAENVLNSSLEFNRDELMVFFPRTDRSGFYRVFSGAKRVGSVAVNLNSLESNPECLTVAQLEDLTQRSQHAFLATAGSDPGALQEMLVGKPVWHYFLLGALGLVVVELVLVRFWKK